MNTSVQTTLSLGSNLGNREKNLRLAIQYLSDGILSDVLASSFLSTTPVDCPYGTPEFLNAAIVGKTNYSPLKLLKACQAIEIRLGRPADHGFHTNRTVDIDILTYSNITFHSEELTLPHPEMLKREFIVKTLSEILPEFYQE